MATDREGKNNTSFRATLDKSPERPFRFYLRDDSSSRARGQGLHQRNRSYDFLLTNQTLRNRKSKHNVSQVFDKSNLTLWGLTEGFGAEGPFAKVGELDEELSDASLSDGHIVLLTEGNKVLVRGRNDSKQLGFDSRERLSSFKMLSLPSAVQFVRVECGGDFTFALGKGGEVFSWGLNLKGQLGHGHFDPVASAAQLRYLSSPSGSETKSPRISRRSRELADDIKLTAGERIVDVACGALHSLLLTSKGRVFSCGFGETCALGHPNRENLSTFTEVATFSSSEFFNESISSISAGVSHSACISNGKLFLWGLWGSGKNMIFQSPKHVPINSTTSFVELSASTRMENIEVVDQVCLGDLLTVILAKSGRVYTLGDNILGQLGISNQLTQLNIPQKVNIEREISDISCGSNHVICHTKDCKQVYAWGSNKKNQILPNSSTKRFDAPIKITQLRQSLASKIICGPRTTFCVSRLTPEFPKENASKPNEMRAIETQMTILKRENDNLTKQNSVALTEVEKLKSEIKNLKIALQNAERQQTKRGFLSNVSTQTEINPQEPEGEVFDVMQHFKKKLKIDRTVRPCFEIDFNELKMEKQISEGGFGMIYRARWRETTVAVKVLKPDLMREETIKDFLNECYAMESLRHPNIVMFMGACTKLPNLAIVLEYCSRKSLWSLLQNRDINLTWEDKRRLSVEIARGMNYLHSFKTPVLHRDLKSLNVLIDDGFRPKIADFGWTRLKADVMTGKIGTYQWMAPEVIKSQKYTEMADVFSFGIIMWEIAAREPPFRNISGVQVSLEVVNNDLRPTIPKNTPEAFSRMMKKCWDRVPEKRPTFLGIIKELELMKLPKY